MTQPRKFHLFNCDSVYELSIVEDLLKAVKAKLGFPFSVEKHNFTLSEMSELSTKTIPAMKMDFAMFVVHAHESVLLINNDDLEHGYAKVYRALLQATGGNVIVVIGGDDNYKNATEEEQFVISRWAKRKIAYSQFSEEFMDGRESFVFSWNKKHREIHEEALLHYFDPNKKGHKFEYQPPQEPSSQTPQSARSTELEMKAVEEDPAQQLSSLVSRIEVGKEMGNRTGPRPKEVNTSSSSSEDLAILCCNVPEDSTEAVMMVFRDITPKLNLSATPVFENLSPDKIKEYLMNVNLKACVLVVDGKTVKDAYKNLPEQKEEFRGLLEIAVEKVEKVIILIYDNSSLQPRDEEIVSRAIEEIVIRRKKGFIAWLKNGRLSVDLADLVPYLMSTSPTSQPNTQNNYLKASQEKNIDAPGSGAKSLQRNPPDRKQGHWNNAPNTPQAATATQPYHPPAVNVSGEPVLLRSLLRYGRISYHLKDLQLWDPKFTVPDHINQTLFQQYRDTPVTGVTIVQRTDGALQCSVDPKLIEVSRSRDEGIKIADNETLMLKTRIRCGKVSFQESDVHFRYGTWQIPQSVDDNLKKVYWATPSGDLYIISDDREQLRMVVKVGAVNRARSALNNMGL